MTDSLLLTLGEETASGRGSKTYRIRLDPAGRVVIPSEVRNGLAVRSGDELLLREDDGGIRLETFSRALGHAQEFFARFVTPDRTREGSTPNVPGARSPEADE